MKVYCLGELVAVVHVNDKGVGTCTHCGAKVKVAFV
jgi:hypothetical protein